MVDFVNKIELSDQKYKTNATAIYDNCNEKFLFTMMEFVSFGTYIQLMYFMSTRLLKDKIYGVHVP